jgi:hypothetical protein
LARGHPLANHSVFLGFGRLAVDSHSVFLGFGRLAVDSGASSEPAQQAAGYQDENDQTPDADPEPMPPG